MKNRSELREIIMKVIYQINILKSTNLDYDIKLLIKEQIEVENDFVNDTVNGIVKNQENINKLANKYLENWTIDRLNKVDQAILSIGIYELMYTKTLLANKFLIWQPMIIIAIIYLICTMVLSFLVKQMEKRLSVSD